MIRSTTPIRISTLCALVAGLLVYTSVSFAQQELRPNLKALPAFDLEVVSDVQGNICGPPLSVCLIFSALTWNSGDGPLKLEAGETGPAGQNVYQIVDLSDGTSYQNLAGTFAFHEAHNHFHFGDYAIYTLQLSGAPGGSQRISSKTTFCIIDTDRINHRLTGAPKKAVYTTCNAFLQGMSVGWGDEYHSGLPGQAIDVTGLGDGNYNLTIEADPQNRILETDDNDNVACAVLNLSVSAQSVTVLDTSCDDPDGGEVTVTSISPNTAGVGSVENVTITGAGFVAGMSVSFENGSGPAPSASNITVTDPNTITATVTVKNGGSPNERIWDVRVGPGLLSNGFTIQP